MQPEISQNDFEQKTATGKVLVEFFATWCPHCKRQQPITDEAANELRGNTAVYQVDVDKNPELAQEYAPDGFPTYVLFKNGQPVAEHVGECPLPALLEMVEAH